jgi:hypothetical protein
MSVVSSYAMQPAFASSRGDARRADEDRRPNLLQPPLTRVRIDTGPSRQKTTSRLAAHARLVFDGFRMSPRHCSGAPLLLVARIGIDQRRPMYMPNPIHSDLLSPRERLAEVCRLLTLGLVRLRVRNSGQTSAPAESFAYTIRPTDAVMRTPTHEVEEDA